VESGRRFGDPISYDQLIQLDAHGWELYNLNTDFAETNNLAEAERDRLIAMIGMWYVEAGKYNVLPIDSRGTLRFAVERPQITADRQRYIYYPGTQMVPLNSAPRVLNRPHSISVEVEVPEGGADGVLFSMGGNDGGFSIYVLEGVFTYGYNYVADSYFYVRATSALPAGHHVLSVEFQPTGPADLAAGKGTPAHITLFVDGAPVGAGDLPVTIPLSLGLAAGVMVGQDSGSPAVPDYNPPFPWPGLIQRALVDVSGTPIEDQEARIREVLARQ
jgi:arylsulfatase